VWRSLISGRGWLSLSAQKREGSQQQGCKGVQGVFVNSARCQIPCIRPCARWRLAQSVLTDLKFMGQPETGGVAWRIPYTTV
jgi:hypothetical protein